MCKFPHVCMHHHLPTFTTSNLAVHEEIKLHQTTLYVTLYVTLLLLRNFISLVRASSSGLRAFPTPFTRLLSAPLMFATQLLRNLVYCNGSNLDQALTCLEIISEVNCRSNPACTWTNRFFGVRRGAINITVTMMTGIDNAIFRSMGWLFGPHWKLRYYQSRASGIMPFSYCAAR